MNLIVILLIVLLLLGGGIGYHSGWYAGPGPGLYLGGSVGTILLIVIVLLLLGVL